MDFPTLAPHIPLPSAGASEKKLTDDEITTRMRCYAEAVAREKAYVHRSYLTEGFMTKPTRGKAHYPNILALRDAALAKFNQDDAAAGRPLVTSVILEGRTLLPNRSYFEDLARARGLTFLNDEERRAAHTREYHAAHAFAWACETV